MSKNIKLNMSRRIRRTPYTNRVEKHGVSDFTVVNHMLLPKRFKKSIEDDYWHLSKEVQIWDVSCQRQVQISGPDAFELVQKMTPRSLENSGKVEGASHIPRGMLEVYLDPNSPVFQNGQIDQNKEFILFCAGGVRSALAVKSLKDMGYQKVSHIDGGFGSISSSKFKII